ncbi:hypothetical protein PR048_014010 [Dryococelus australis]|uniref:Uncharacterized protein n=1 Tax=Dryococelus australis TaxID=614101 RepID=A0ABQ9HTS1_9NEOP|nr:hypothetical protein PR048_014010 [Dryococelus australis]
MEVDAGGDVGISAEVVDGAGKTGDISLEEEIDCEKQLVGNIHPTLTYLAMVNVVYKQAQTILLSLRSEIAIYRDAKKMTNERTRWLSNEGESQTLAMQANGKREKTRWHVEHRRERKAAPLATESGVEFRKYKIRKVSGFRRRALPSIPEAFFPAVDPTCRGRVQKCSLIVNSLQHSSVCIRRGREPNCRSYSDRGSAITPARYAVANETLDPSPDPRAANQSAGTRTSKEPPRNFVVSLSGDNFLPDWANQNCVILTPSVRDSRAGTYNARQLKSSNHETVRLLASHQGERGSILGPVTPGFSQVVIVQDVLVGGFSQGSPVSPSRAFRRCSKLSSLLRAAQIYPLRSTRHQNGGANQQHLGIPFANGNLFVKPRVFRGLSWQQARLHRSLYTRVIIVCY